MHSEDYHIAATWRQHLLAAAGVVQSYLDMQQMDAFS